MLGTLRTLTTCVIHRPMFHAQAFCFPYYSSIQTLSFPEPSWQEKVSDEILHPTKFFCLSSLRDLIGYLWFAVPKRKVTPGKKRMKTTLQNRIKPKSHVIVDRRTGELTLRHRLPWNWKDYLPESLQNKIS